MARIDSLQPCWCWLFNVSALDELFAEDGACAGQPAAYGRGGFTEDRGDLFLTESFPVDQPHDLLISLRQVLDEFSNVLGNGRIQLFEGTICTRRVVEGERCANSVGESRPTDVAATVLRENLAGDPE